MRIKIDIKCGVSTREYVVKNGKSDDHFLAWRSVVPSEGLTVAVIHSGCLPEEPSFLFRILFFFAGGTSRSGIGDGVLHNSSNDGQGNGDNSMAVDVEGFTRLKSIGVSEAGAFGIEACEMG